MFGKPLTIVVLINRFAPQAKIIDLKLQQVSEKLRFFRAVVLQEVVFNAGAIVSGPGRLKTAADSFNFLKS